MIQIFTHTPLWVWGLLLALSILGLSQTRNRQVSLTRLTILPVAMLALSLNSLIATFGTQAWVFCAWLLAGTLCCLFVVRTPLPAGTVYRAETRQIAIPGSYLPLFLIWGIFLTKYVVAIAVAMSPNLKHDVGFSLILATVFGSFSGIFLGRTVRLWRLVLSATGDRDAKASTISV